LKGLVRCAYYGMPMWAQTYQNGQKYYREHKNSRSYGICPAASGSIPCHKADEQVISFEDIEYTRQKRMLELELESLIIPEVHAAEEAGKLLQNLPHLWSLANLEEQRKLLVSMLDAVYIDTKNNLIVAVKPKPPFRPVFQVAASREKSAIRIINEPIEGSSLFLVETGESRTPRPEEATQDILQD
jgi:site-specific DNA recombinase